MADDRQLSQRINLHLRHFLLFQNILQWDLQFSSTCTVDPKTSIDDLSMRCFPKLPQLPSEKVNKQIQKFILIQKQNYQWQFNYTD